MHASPPFQMIVRHFGAWRAASSLLVVCAIVVVGAWAPHAFELTTGWAWFAILLLAISSVASATLAWRLQPMSLRWDTQCWSLGAANSAGHEPHTGRLRVALDLGPWMLLHFIYDESSALHRGSWLPVQRRGHEADWHPLRCTVYCARPVSLPTVAPF